MGCGTSNELNRDSRQPQLAQMRMPNNQSLNEKSSEAKIVLLGDMAVGKSSIALRFCQGRFQPFHDATIGAAFLQQIVRLKDGSQLKLHIWDTGGQERFRAMLPLYYRCVVANKPLYVNAWALMHRDSAGAIIVYDCTHTDTFESVKYWSEELKQKGPHDVCLYAVANKCDLP
eukprot:Platyproteum_vivax@DN6568_c0_g1_i3.p1